MSNKRDTQRLLDGFARLSINKRAMLLFKMYTIRYRPWIVAWFMIMISITMRIAVCGDIESTAYGCGSRSMLYGVGKSLVLVAIVIIPYRLAANMGISKKIGDYKPFVVALVAMYLVAREITNPIMGLAINLGFMGICILFFYIFNQIRQRLSIV